MNFLLKCSKDMLIYNKPQLPFILCPASVIFLYHVQRSTLWHSWKQKCSIVYFYAAHFDPEAVIAVMESFYRFHIAYYDLFSCRNSGNAPNLIGGGNCLDCCKKYYHRSYIIEFPCSSPIISKVPATPWTRVIKIILSSPIPSKLPVIIVKDI